MTDDTTAPQHENEGHSCPTCGDREIARELTAYTHPELDAGDGNRETWLMGKVVDQGVDIDFRLDSGAGLGDTHLALLVEFNDGGLDEAPDRRWEYIDVTTLIEDWVTRIIADRAAELAALAAGPLVPDEVAAPLLARLAQMEDEELNRME